MNKHAMLQTATRLIRQSGGRVRLSYVDGSTSSGYGVVTKPSQKLMELSSVSDGTLVCWLQGTLKKAPGPGDMLKVGAKDYTIEQVDRIQPDGSMTYAYIATVRA